MRKIGVLFDLDGVLIDSESLYTGFWSGIDRDYPTGIPDFARFIKGSTLDKIMGYFPSEQVREDILDRIREFEKGMKYEMFDGVAAFLDDLAANNIPAAVVTSSSDRKMEKVYAQLPGFRERFAAIVTGSMVSRSKPDPQGYLMGAEAIGCAPTDCYVFEDSMSGLQAGNAAGATVVGLATTLPRETLEGHAHRIIDRFVGFDVRTMLGISR